MQNSKSRNFYTLVISNRQSFISHALKVVDPLGEKFDFLSLLRFMFKVILILKRQNHAPLSQSFEAICKQEKFDS